MLKGHQRATHNQTKNEKIMQTIPINSRSSSLSGACAFSITFSKDLYREPAEDDPEPPATPLPYEFDVTLTAAEHLARIIDTLQVWSACRWRLVAPCCALWVGGVMLGFFF